MIDLHTHILPDLDDGPATVSEALALARAAYDSGTDLMVATPHVLHNLNSAQNSQILSVFREFQDILAIHLPQLSLVLGSEIYFQPGLSDLAQYVVATINGNRRYMLIEFPLADIPKAFERELWALRGANLTPIIAHPERNGAVLNKPALVGRMIEAGALVQINAGSLTGLFGRATKKLAHYLLKMGWVHFIGSDAHGLRQRGPDLNEAVEAAVLVIGVAAARRLVEDHPRMIVEGAPWPGGELAELLLGDEDD